MRLLLLFFLLYFVYEPLTTLFVYLPPMLAVASWKIYKARRLRYKLLWGAYLVLFEMDHSLPPLSTVLAVLGVGWVIKRLEVFLNCKICLLIVNVTLFYALFATIIFLFHMLFNTGFYLNPWLLGLYVILDLGILLLYEI